MGRWVCLCWYLSLVAIGHGKALLDLSGQETANGTWRAPVALPCVYEPSVDFKVLRVTWKYIAEEQGVRSIILQDSSGDHTLLTEFRGRVSIAEKPPGDVSLQINGLEMTDTGEYFCQVEWEATNGSRIFRERRTKLKVIKVPVSKPVIQSSHRHSILPSGTRFQLTCLASGSPPIQYRWYKELGGAEPEPLQRGAVLAFNSLQIADTARYFCTAENRIGSQEWQSDSFLITVKDASEFPTGWPGTTSGDQKSTGTGCCPVNDESTTPLLPNLRGTVKAGWKVEPVTGIVSSFPQVTSIRTVPASQRKGLPVPLTVSIALLCVALLLVILSVAFCRRRKTKTDNTYEVSYHNSSHYEEPNSGFGNNYVEEPCQGGDYVAMSGPRHNEYEIMVDEKGLLNGRSTFK